jgi:anti-anti-sigma factor
MISAIFNSPATVAIRPYLLDNMTELVKGNDLILLERMTPLVHRQSVTLDLEIVERIDAAGIAVLISLYCRAHESGHTFTVSNLSPRVAEILSIVGLDRILLSQNAGHDSHYAPYLAKSAA